MQHPSLVEKGGEGYIETFHSFIFDVKCILGLPFHSFPGIKKKLTHSLQTQRWDSPHDQSLLLQVRFGI